MSAPKIVEWPKPGELLFWCPGCESHHAIRTPPWSWNGNDECPDVSPSVLTTGRVLDEHNQVVTSRCHLFIRNGAIEFLTDSTHKLAGKTVPMEPTCLERFAKGVQP